MFSKLRILLAQKAKVVEIKNEKTKNKKLKVNILIERSRLFISPLLLNKLKATVNVANNVLQVYYVRIIKLQRV